MAEIKLSERFKNAVILERKGRYSDALREYLSIIKTNPSHREAHLNLGSLYSRMNKLPEAMKFYQNALNLKNDYITYFNLGSIYYKMGNYKKAVISLEKSKVLNNKFILSTLVAGLCYSRMNDLKAAESNFTGVLKLMPHNRVALTALAIIYYNKGEYTSSLKLLDRLIILDGSNPSVRELKSNVLYKTGKIDESAKEIKTLKKISDGYLYYDEFIKSVPVEAYTDKYGTINEKINFLKESAGKDSSSLMSLSLCHLFKGETDLAIDYLFKFRKIYSN